MKRFLCLLLSAILLLGLCACSENNQNPGDRPTELTPPDLIYGSWYPMPDVSETPVEVYEDGTCVVNGQQWNWVTKSVAEEKVVLAVGTGEDQFEIEFLYLTSDVPVLAQKQVDWAVRNPELWSYTTEWYNEQNGDAFTLTLFEMQENNCSIELQDGMMVVEVPQTNGSYILEFTAGECVVTTPVGTSIVYVPVDGGMGGSSDYGDDADAAMAKYDQAMQDLNQVLTLGYMYVQDGNVSKRVNGSEAIERLYHTFVSLQNYVDVSNELMRIQKLDNVLIETQWTTVGGETITSKFTYDAFGNKMHSEIPLAINAGEAIYTYTTKDGKPWAIIWGGLEGGEAVYDSYGRVTALKMTNPGDGDVYIAPVTYDAYGRVIRVDVPFVLSVYEDENETDFTEYSTFLYDDAGRLIQSTLTRECHNGIYEPHEFYQEYGYCERTVTEYYYDASGRLAKTMEHTAMQASDGSSMWWFKSGTYTYDSAGKLVSDYKASYSILHTLVGSVSTPREEILRMNEVQAWVMNAEEFVNSETKDFLGQIEGHYDSDQLEWITEYKYGSIYIFNAEM